MFFERIAPGGVAEFYKFTMTHFITALVCFYLIYLFWKNTERIKHSKHETLIRYLIALFMLLTNISIWYYAYKHGLPWYKYLPEATCGWAIYFGGFGLLFKNRTLLLLCLFWGFGALSTILGANVLEGPLRYNFYQFFMRHILIVVAGIYMVKVLGYKVYRNDFKTYFIVTFIMVILGGLISWTVGEPESLNMFYTLKPGIDGTPLSWLLDKSYWLYIVTWIIVGSGLGYIYAYPFYEKKTP